MAANVRQAICRVQQQLAIRSHLINRRGCARAVRGGWQGASDAHTRVGLKGASNAARRRELLLSSGWRRFLTWVALLLGHPAAAGRICSLVAPYPSQKSTATLPLPFMRWLLITRFNRLVARLIVRFQPVEQGSFFRIEPERLRLLHKPISSLRIIVRPGGFHS